MKKTWISDESNSGSCCIVHAPKYRPAKDTSRENKSFMKIQEVCNSWRSIWRVKFQANHGGQKRKREEVSNDKVLHDRH